MKLTITRPSGKREEIRFVNRRKWSMAFALASFDPFAQIFNLSLSETAYELNGVA